MSICLCLESEIMYVKIADLEISCFRFYIKPKAMYRKRT